MAIVDRWLLPEGIEELLPEQAAEAELMRRRLLDLYHTWGYELVMPPMVEFVESLLIGLGSDLDLQSFKVTDQLSGRSLAIRPDITPQVARIDAHSINKEGAVRLCYAGTVLHARAKNVQASRAPLQVGAELYGDDSQASDVEIACLMLETLRTVGIDDITLDLGHAAIYNTLISGEGLSVELEAQVFNALQRKSSAELTQLLESNSALAGDLIALIGFHGDLSVVDDALLYFSDNSVLQKALKRLKSVSLSIKKRIPEVNHYFDLAEPRGYRYHTGIVFSAFIADCGRSIANGGRYDDIGKAFGRARPATGFNTDLKTLLSFSQSQCVAASVKKGVFAPADEDTNLWQMVQSLRSDGQQVIYGMPSAVDEDPRDLGCDRQLIKIDGLWCVEALTITK